MRGFRSGEHPRGGPGMAEVTAVGPDRQYFTLTSETQHIARAIIYYRPNLRKPA